MTEVRIARHRRRSARPESTMPSPDEGRVLIELLFRISSPDDRAALKRVAEALAGRIREPAAADQTQCSDSFIASWLYARLGRLNTVDGIQLSMTEH